MRWYKSTEWLELLGELEAWLSEALDFVYQTQNNRPSTAFRETIHNLIYKFDDLSPHIDPTPLWKLWDAIDERYLPHFGKQGLSNRPRRMNVCGVCIAWQITLVLWRHD